MTFYKIWIPSQQKYARFKEISSEQYREISKCIDDDEDFEYATNNLLLENSKDLLDIHHLTIIDKFVLLLQLKIHSCGSILELTRICDKCKEKTNFSVDLNDLITNLSNKIDCSFEEEYEFPNIKVICDVPLVSTDFFQHDKNNVIDRINLYLFSFIKKIIVDGKTVELYKFFFNERMKICSTLSLQIVNHIKENYIEKLHSLFSDMLITNTVCSNDKCKDVLYIKFNINSLIDVNKFLFRDASNSSILSQYINLSMNCHLDYNFYNNICPAELNIIEKLVNNSLKKPEKQEKSNNDINMFEQYKLKDQQMIENPSEFE